MKLSKAGKRNTARWSVLVVVLGLMIAGGYRGFVDVLHAVPVDNVVGFLDGQTNDGEIWKLQEKTACGFTGGSCVTRIDRCREDFCLEAWDLLRERTDPTQKRLASVQIVSIRDPHRFDAWLRMLSWEPAGWVPHLNEKRDILVDKSIASTSDEISIACIYNEHASPADTDRNHAI